jgi:uncharacterized protein involved in exopolysaccharide biosynthesis
MSEQASLYEYWNALYARRILIAVVAAASFGFALVLSWILPGFYEARTVFYLPYGLQAAPYSVEDPAGLGQSPLLPTPEEKAAGTHVGILKSKDLLRRVQQQFPDRSLDTLRDSVDFVVGKEFLTEVYARDREAEVAAGIANAYAEAYEAFHREAMARRSRITRDTMEAKLDANQTALAERRAELAALQRQKSAVGGIEERDRLTNLATELGHELETTRADLSATQGRIKSLHGELGAERALYRDGESAFTNASIERLEQEVADLEVEQAGLPYTREHPQAVATAARLERLRQALEAERGKLAKSRSKEPGSTYETLRRRFVDEQSQQRYLEARTGALERTIADLDARKLTLGVELAALDDAQRRVDMLVTVQGALERNLEEAGMQAEHPAPAIVVTERAEAPARLAFPLPLLNASVAAVLGLAVGCYYALFADYLERIRRERVRREMDWTPLAPPSETGS